MSGKGPDGGVPIRRTLSRTISMMSGNGALPVGRSSLNHGRVSSNSRQNRYLDSPINQEHLLKRLAADVHDAVTLPNLSFSGTDPVEERRGRKRYKHALRKVLNSPSFDLFIIGLVFLDVVLLFANHALSSAKVRVAISGFTVLAFLFEMLAKHGMLGIYGYWKDVWNIADGGITIVSLLGFILEVAVSGIDDSSSNDSNSGNAETVAEGMRIVRLLRIFRVFSLVTKMKKHNYQHAIFKNSDSTVHLPMVVCLDILSRCLEIVRNATVQTLTKNLCTVEDIEWVMTTLRTDKLYHPAVKLDENLPDSVKQMMGGGGGVGLKSGDELEFGITDSGMPTTLPSELNIGADDPSLEDLFDNWEFDVFRLNEACGGRSLPLVSYMAFHRLGLVDHFQFSDDRLLKFLLKINDLYEDNPFHNAVRAAACVADMSFLLCKAKLADMLTPTEILSLLLAAIVQSCAHPGVTDVFLSKTNDPIAIQYNKTAVSRNRAIVNAFPLFNDPELNFLDVTDDAKLSLASLIASTSELIIETDISKHYAMLSQLGSRVLIGEATSSAAFRQSSDRNLISRSILHVCNLAHFAKGYDVVLRWHKLLMEEFYNQGDREKELNIPVSMHMARSPEDIQRRLEKDNLLGYESILTQPFFKEFICLLDIISDDSPDVALVVDSISTALLQIKSDVAGAVEEEVK